MIRALAVAALLSLAGCGASLTDKPAANHVALPAIPPPPPLSDDRVMCAADVQTCADGSFVSRDTARGCAFNACPGETTP